MIFPIFKPKEKVVSFVAGIQEEKVEIKLSGGSKMELYRIDGDSVRYNQEGGFDNNYGNLNKIEYDKIICLVDGTKQKLTKILLKFKIIGNL